MNYFRVHSGVIAGISGFPVQVECAQSRRLPFLQIIGGSSTDITELRERVVAALDSSGFRLPSRRTTVQLQPGVHGLPMESLDLAVALAILGSNAQIPPASLEGILVSAKLGLDGSIRPCGNPSALRRLLHSGAHRSALLSWEESEVLEADQLRIGGGFHHLGELVRFLQERKGGGRKKARAPADIDLEDCVPPSARIWNKIPGQEVPKRLLEVSAAGAHHVLFSGPEVAGANLLAHALSSLLPPLSLVEAEEVRSIYSLAGLPLVPSRPFFAYSSAPALPTLIPDRRMARLEEVLLAHKGVLYIDRLAERESRLFPGLVSPMLHGILSAKSASHRSDFPADFIVVASVPGCACGAKGDPAATCLCRPGESRRQEERVRRLLRYPFDLHLPLFPESASGGSDPPEARAERVAIARGRMAARQRKWNARLMVLEALQAKSWEKSASSLWSALENRKGANPRSAEAVARVALTLSDLRDSELVQETDVLEAKHYCEGVGSS